MAFRSGRALISSALAPKLAEVTMAVMPLPCSARAALRSGISRVRRRRSGRPRSGWRREPASEPTWMMRGLVVMLSYKWVAKGPCYLIRAQWPGAASGGCWLLVHLGLSRVPWRGARAVSGLANDGRGVDAFIGCSALRAIECAGPIGLGYCSGRESSHMDSRIFRIFLILVFQNECGSAGGQANRPGLSESRRKPDMKDALSNMKSIISSSCIRFRYQTTP